jgi:hypothetical protein
MTASPYREPEPAEPQRPNPEKGRKRTATPGVFKNANRFHVHVTENGKRRWWGFDTYEEACAFKERRSRRPRRQPAPPPPPGLAHGFVYFVQQGAAGPVRIGWTNRDADERLAELQPGNPEPLSLLGVHHATRRQYQAVLLHRFAAQRIRGKWFQPTPELIDLALYGLNTDDPMRGWLAGLAHERPATERRKRKRWPRRSASPARAA